VRGKGFADVFKSFTQPIADKFEQTKKTFNALAFGLSDYNKAVRDVLERYGDMPIRAILVCRNPVSEFVKTGLDVLSFGKFKKRLANQPYDTIYHLFCLITLEDGTVLTLDKQALISLTVGSKAYKSSVAVPPPFTTLNEMLNNTRKAMGDKDFFGYDSLANNCQNFLFKFFRSNGKLTPELKNFIVQDVKGLFDENLEKKSRFITDLGSKISTIQYGGDLC
jgi:hypothetical protein